ncbi:uncharacterized protein [Rhodnius prolixus]|uniref:Uncharacterized protein n=1 Tax=Rhodnius neglectus TaxID=72488 RepID=A0A0P4VK25_9HEMI
MFGGIGGALKSLSGKAEEMIEKTKTSVGEMAAEKKAAAAAMLEGQAKKTGDLLWQTKTNAETGVSEIVTEGKAAAIDGFDKEVASAEKLVEEGLNEKSQEISKDDAAKTPTGGEAAPAGLPFDPAKLLAGGAAASGLANVDKEVEKAVDGAIKQVSTTVDAKLKETDQFIDEKREQVVTSVQEETQKSTAAASEGFSSVLGKAKGLLNF